MVWDHTIFGDFHRLFVVAVRVQAVKDQIGDPGAGSLKEKF
jgi:hypothetical protein